ncbi:unnamed protein product [Knipowitschia caucasica]
MDGEEEVSHMRDDLDSDFNSIIERKKREAKGRCLRIEGEDGYVFQSYSLHSHRSSATKEVPSSQSTTLDTNSMSLNLSQVKKENADTEIKECENYKNGNEENPHELNGSEDIPIDESLAFSSSVDCSSKDCDEYSTLLSGYSSTLYDVAMDAVTHSLLSAKSPSNPRKKSPAWNHFCISPRDSTKAICLYCMKEFSRGKNEKDLSTSCLMRHVRRAHPTVLVQDGTDASVASITNSLTSPLIPLSPNSPKNGDLTNDVITPASEIPSLSTSEVENSDLSPKEVFPKIEPKLEPKLEPIFTNVDSFSSLLLASHSNDNSEELSDGGQDNFLGTTKCASTRRRSAVWKHFYLSPTDSSKAVCIHCMNEFSRGKNGKDLGTSCLIRHMWRAHKEVVIEENGQGNHIPPPYTTPPSLLSRTRLSDTLDLKTSPLRPSSPETTSDVSHSFSIKEESDDVPVPSGQESSLDMSIHVQDNSTSHNSSPYDLSEGTSTEDHSIFQQNKKIMKRVKSEVWHHFIVSPVDQLKALCRYCPCVISRGKRGDFGTSCLMRHLMRRHPDVLKNTKVEDKETFPNPFACLIPTDELSLQDISSVKSPPKKDKKSPGLSKKTSKLWNHFSISLTDPTKVICLHCNRIMSRGKKTTNLGTSCLFRHMQRFHADVLETKKTSISGDEMVVKHDRTLEPNKDADGERHLVSKKITRLLAEMIALDLQPSAIVENAGLIRLLEFLQPQYSLPPSSYFTSTAIPDMYEKVKDVVLTHLKEAEGGVVHFTTSIWVSSQTREYLTLNAHWASYESRIKPQGQDFHCSALLSVSQIDCDTDLHDIPKQLEHLWDTWITTSGLKRGFILTDNNIIGNTLEDYGHATMQCFGHTIDLIVNEAIKSQRMVQNLLSIARKICERVHRSAKAKEKLTELQNVYELPENQLIQDVPSKWRTSLLMLERMVEQRQAIDELSIVCNFREIISCDQWEVMLSVCNALKPFDVASKEMVTHAATLGQVIPLIHILNRKIDLLFDETVGIDNMLKSLKEAMVSRMSPMLHDSRYIWATMLDPRYKTSLFTEEEAECRKQDLIRELDLDCATSDERNSHFANGYDESNRAKKDNIWSFMNDVRKNKHLEKPKSSELAVHEYLEEDILDQNCDPLNYWNHKKVAWPNLAQVAARYVGCPPSIIPAETLFHTSSVNCVLNQPRPLLENMEGLLFLKVNLPMIYFQY